MRDGTPFDQSRNTARTACPDCGTPLTAEARFSSWCESCGWNLIPANGRTDRSGPVQRTLARLGARTSDRLRSEASSATGLRPRLNPAKVLALVLAAMVHLLTLALVAAGVFLVTQGGVIPIAAGLVLFGMAWVCRPRPVETPDDAIDPETIRYLADLANRVAEGVGTHPADMLRLEADFNASVVEVGWRRRRVLSIGVPLFAVLEPQERVAVLAHEFGHFVNGDLLRGWFAQTAVNSLLQWVAVLRPHSLVDNDETGIPWPLMLPANLAMLALAWIPLGAALALLTLTFRDSQRAEYLADVRSTEVAGTDAAVASLTKLHLANVFDSVSQASSDADWLNNSLWDELRMRAEQLPESERNRAHRIEVSHASRVDLSHPPTAFRRSVVQSRAHHLGTVHVDRDAAIQIDAELRKASDRLQRGVIEHHLARISY